MTTVESFLCHACGAAVNAVPAPALRFIASSDCTPVSGDVQIGTCESCGLLQKDTGRAWQELCRQIYGDYQIYHQAGGMEQKARGPGEGQFAPRSELIARHLSQAFSLPQHGSALDLGCGNGAFLRGMSRCFPGWPLTGSDLNESFRDEITAIDPQVAFMSEAELDRGHETFDVVSLIHCIEHIPDPSGYLHRARRFIKPTGVLLIEVPDAELESIRFGGRRPCKPFFKKTLAQCG